MKGQRAALRYAKSLMQLAADKGALEAVIADVKMIHALIEQSKDLQTFLASPLVKADKKRNVIMQLFENKVNALTLRFLEHVVEQGREAQLKSMMEQYVDLSNAQNGIAKVHLSTATAIDKDSKEAILKALQAHYKLNKIELSENVDPSLLGGMVLRIGDQQLDASIRRQLQKIENELVQAQ